MMFFGWLLIGAFLYLVFANGNSNMPRLNTKSPREILDERFVNGEIDESTYTRMKNALN